MKRVSSFIFHKLMGWSIEGLFDPEKTKKCIVIVVPHTSWHDFFIGLLVRQIVDLKISFLGKKELFKGPFGWYFKKVGGIPLDRTPGQNKVEAIAQIFENKEVLRLALAPEGTRKKVSEWKTGFYHIAKAAEVPVVMVAFDFGNKKCKIADAFYPTKDMEADIKFMYTYYKGIKGKISQYSFDPDID